ncbi:hypothetical protein CLAFUW4_01375 [Fulvia fulva]|uniref:Uncharacterized protein n=1 Tax=Passalora fulva TaxID=5499 RepID=A0A9Q8P3G6_PASFU|nr:uncharacterized protein CLAFUR5_01378 [Fulvia fulva]KAK4634660.1 hypothetical protein CLAFUR4_01376 [Fulvia fulva]KAK4637066.1 hypothetical protein CLAFUR0_01377 [Fulvia fulva]UJO11731.1 hypothetical protein CLAFUR5_01378 [Fulvia fulva]WPV09046.1 hypothetical protein CLAFUW4_01375 [Fulvia fulva]WPV25023.1 hypothetical protein CLAFUW7_01380 [Fulvia fulva]
MKFTALLIAASAALASAQRSTVRHFYSPDPNGEYARQVGFTGASNLWGYGLSQNLSGTVPMYDLPAPHHQNLSNMPPGTAAATSNKTNTYSPPPPPARMPPASYSKGTVGTQCSSTPTKFQVRSLWIVT